MMIVFFVLGFKIILLFMFVYRIVSRILKKQEFIGCIMKGLQIYIKFCNIINFKCEIIFWFCRYIDVWIIDLEKVVKKCIIGFLIRLRCISM